MNNKRKFTTRDLIAVGVLAALCTIATFLKIPLGTGSMVHLGSGAIFSIGIVFGGVYAGMAGGIGSALFDLLLGFSPYTIWSFVIKGIAGLIVGTVAKGLWPETTAKEATISNTTLFVKAALGCVLAAAWTLGGYMLAWWKINDSLTIAIANIPASLLTSGVGFLIAMLIAPKLRKVIKW
jgi:uncharacterized membrane protein